MLKKIYLIRHCEAEGQSFEAQLTDRGFKQAVELADFFLILKLIVLFQVHIYGLFNPYNRLRKG